MVNLLSKFFGFDPKKNSIRTEIVAGITTFITMAYILAVNPNIFNQLDMPSGAVFTSTALIGIIATMVMAFHAKKPFALAPGMGLNAFFVYTVCIAMGHRWQFALTAVFIEGIIFVVLTLTKIRSMILDAIPTSLKFAISAGIGFYITFIGLQNAGIIVDSKTTLVTLGDLCNGRGLLAVIGLVISCTLVMLHVKGGILLGILITAIIGVVIKDPVTGANLTTFNGVIAMPHSVSPIFFQFEWENIFTLDMLVVVFTFLFIDIFSTIGTVIGVSQKAGLINNNGRIMDAEKVFMADAIGTIVGSCIGTSTVTTYVESSAGVGAGGRTGLTAFSTAICFALALFFSPIFLAIPSSATAPALIIVGMMMMQPITMIDWTDYRESIPAYITMILMPMAYSISDGILIGIIFYVVFNTLCGRFEKITKIMWVLAVLFILRYILI